jgi:hypothetical protein
LRKDERIPSLKYSPMKMEIASVKGRQISNARKEVRRVPMRNAAAPNLLETGSHVLLKKKLRPKALSEGKEEIMRLSRMARAKATTANAEITRIL